MYQSLYCHQFTLHILFSPGGGLSRFAMSIELPIASGWTCRKCYHPKSMFGRLCAGSYSGGDKGICPVCCNMYMNYELIHKLTTY